MKKRNPSRKSKKPNSSRKYLIALAIVVLLAFFGILSRDTPPAGLDSTNDDVQETAPQASIPQATTLRLNGEEFTPDFIMTGFNSFMRDVKADSLCIEELVPEFGARADVYRDIKNDENISISITTRQGGSAVTSVSVRARKGGEKPTAFMTYCSALMNIFNPTMNDAVRQRVLYNMMGYEEGADKPLADENTYIIAETKYTFTCSEQKELSMLIEQMPDLEEASGDELPRPSNRWIF